MSPEQIAAFALDFPEVTEEQPFGPGADVYKVAGKVFVILTPNEDPPRVTLKCEPSLALHLRGQYEAVSAGYHVDKKHWNTVLLDGTVPPDQLEEMVEHSYLRVVAGMTKAARSRIELALTEG
ncbi:MmcQ/YjbR family DNA-binding protein [Amycolatopsis nigrescens]|uniref:MmcQ/YjbR family DNA-binding protein n=1 Tax=Amycolatopsis nigrescens TaxID=381445 RepID=UPI0003748D67|nr:MmcQ/YjbR family DNA-binding protein [Amycolatopsis nigrescens]